MASVLVAAVVFVFYQVKADSLQTSDPMWAPYVTASLLYDGDPFLNEYREWIEEANYYGIIKVGDRLDSLFPIGGSLLAIAPSVILDVLLPELQGTTLQEFLLARGPGDPAVQRIQLITASLIVALSAGVIYLLSREYLPPAYALAVVSVYAFGTSAYSTASRALWQHGPSILMVSISLLLLVRARRRPDLIRFVALPLALAYIMRPTNAISVVIVTIYVLLFYRKYFTQYALLGLLLGIPFILFNLSLYDNWLPPYFSAGRLQASPTFVEALLGNLVSPARGLFVFTPVLLLAPVGAAIRVIRKQWTALDWAILAIIILHWLAISSFPHWWAGHSFGPRFFSDVLPYTIYFLIPVLEEIHSSETSSRIRNVLKVTFGVLAVISIAIHYRGVASAATLGWNNLPLNVDEHPGRVWDWTDLQFLRGVGNDLINVSPEHIIVPTNSLPDEQLYIDVGLMTDGPIDITIRLPRRVSLAEHTSWLFDMNLLPGGGQIGKLRKPLSGVDTRRFFIEIELANAIEGASLGAIEVVATERGGRNKGSEEIQVISISNAPQPAGSPVYPNDISIHCSPASSGSLLALFGAGWYDEEVVGDSSWRWASSPAYLHIWSDAEQTASLEIVPSSIHDASASDGLGQLGTIQVSQPGGKTTLTVHGGLPAQFETLLEYGWNTLVFELEAGYFRPADLIPGQFDQRDLSFSIDHLTISGQCVSPSAQP